VAAISRWVRYPIAGTTGYAAVQKGFRGLQRGTANTSDTFTIPGSANNQIKVEIDASGSPFTLTLTSGTNLDPRFVARDIQRKLQAAGAGVSDGYDYCQVEFSNYKSDNGYGQFVIRSGSTGASSEVNITDPGGGQGANAILGVNTKTTENGAAYKLGTTEAPTGGSYTGSVTVSGSYRGLFDDMYQLTIGQDQFIGTPVLGGGNTYGIANAGVCTAGGFWNDNATEIYTVTISTTNGQTVGGGTGNVPTFTVTSNVDAGEDDATPMEILYSGEPYYIGTKGLTLSWTDAPFGSGDTFVITCTPATTVDGTNATGITGVAEYQYRSLLGDDSVTSTVTSTGGTPLGRKGLSITFTNNASAHEPRDEYKVLCKGPTPEAYGISNMVYGNVTVTTESAIKAHQFEIMSGAVDMSSVKFSLQNHGTFAHHDAGDSDTWFRFGTAGFGKPGDGVSANNGPEWTTSVTAADLASAKTSGNTGAPFHLDSVVPDLAVVSSADNAEDVGNRSMVSDIMWTGIRLGAQESGANSSINYRLYFDFV